MFPKDLLTYLLVPNIIIRVSLSENELVVSLLQTASIHLHECALSEEFSSFSTVLSDFKSASWLVC